MTHQIEANAPVKVSEKAPKGWVRWSGLGLFLVIVASVVGLSYLSLSTLVKHKIEDVASQAWGAKVEIGHLGVGLFPLGLKVSQIQVTDPKKPMENLVVIAQVDASLSLYHKVVGRTVIDDLSFKGLALHQPRKTSGALQQAHVNTQGKALSGQASSSSAFKMPDMSLPNPDTMLKREHLATLDKAAEIKQKLLQIRQAWSKLQGQIPNDKVIASYQKRFEDLTHGNLQNPTVLLAKQKEFEALKKDIETQRKALAEAQGLMKQLNQVKKDLFVLRTLPQKDYQRIMSKYRLNGQGLNNVTYLLFGPQIQHYVALGQSFYEKAKPVIEKFKAMQSQKEAEKPQHKRAFGTEVAFKEFDPEPDFIIKRVQGQGNLEGMRLLLGVTQLNFDQPKSRIPTAFKMSLQPKGQQTAFEMNGESNFIHPKHPVNQVHFAWKNAVLSDYVLSQDKTLPVVMQKGQVDLTGQMKLTGLDQIKGQFLAGFNQVKMDVSQTHSSDVKRYVAPIFDGITHFKVAGDVSGNLMAPKIGAKSNLDQLLNKAIQRALGQEVAKAKIEVKKQLNQLLKQQSGPLQQQLSGLLGQGKGLNGKANVLDEILNGNLQKTAQRQAEQAAKKSVEQAIQKQLRGIKFSF